jgi:hypothetical protein
MKHMPYEETVPGDMRGDTPSEDQPDQERGGGPIDDPGHTPRTAEGGGLDEERRMPAGEPGKTPGKAEG